MSRQAQIDRLKLKAVQWYNQGDISQGQLQYMMVRIEKVQEGRWTLNGRFLHL
jgi:hypothetical protein